MRFALIAVSAAAAFTVPWALGVSGPQMASDQFLQAVRCTAIAEMTQPDAQLGAVKMQLNAEARHQPAAIAASARADVREIARAAAHGDRDVAAAALACDTIADVAAGPDVSAGA
jgi:hypothetical protein